MSLTSGTVWGDSPCKTALISDVRYIHESPGPLLVQTSWLWIQTPPQSSLGLIIHKTQEHTESYYTRALLQTQNTENQPKEETHRAESRRSSNAQLLAVPSMWSCGWCDLLLATTWGHTHRVLPTREAPLSLWYPEFLSGINYVLPVWLPFYPQPLTRSGYHYSSLPPEVRTDVVVASKPHHTWHY